MNRLKNCKLVSQETNKKQHPKLIQSAEDVNLTSQKKFCKEITALCQPIFELFNVNYFAHTRAFHNRQFVAVMTNPELTECFLKRKHSIYFSEGNGFYLNDGCYFTNCFTQSFGLEEKLKAFWKEFDIGYLIHIVKKQTGYDDMYYFGLNVQDGFLVNKFLNHLKMIEHFILYFKSQSLGVFNKIEPVSYSQDYFLLPQSKPNISYVTSKEQEIFLKSLPLKKVQVLGKLGNAFLSQREYECLRYANKCYSLKEIAKQINISPRTVETYLNSVKNKLGIARRSDLIMFELDSIQKNK